MADQYVDMNTLRFLLYDVHELEQLLTNPHFEDYDRASIEIFLSSIKDFADQDLYPYFREMDEQPAHYKDGKIVVHPQIKVAIEKAAELGLLQTIFDLEEGGLQMPFPVHTAGTFILEAANNHVLGYYGLTMGAAALIVSFGSQELKDTFVPKMQSGQWGGTMCLTEPQAGSSLSDVLTSATPHADGSYRIKGQKIFISGGDHEYVENVVHLVLARIVGAPPGTKGISLFAVPKKRPAADGQLASNDVITAGDFQKMGQKGYCTTHLVFGEHEDCQGWLVGYEHEGLKNMFQMMNGARIDVGRGAAAITMAAYLASLQYARERPQGRSLGRGGRKLTMHNGMAAHLIAQEIGKTLIDANTFTDLKPYSATLGAKLKQAQEVISFLSTFAERGEHERFLSDATIFMEFFSTIIVGWQWLKMAVVAKRSLVGGHLTFDERFYENKINTMRFFFKYEMAKTDSLAQVLMDETVLTLRSEADVFA